MSDAGHPSPRGSAPEAPLQAAPEALATRRSFLDWAIGGSLVAWSGAIVYPVLRYLTPEPEVLSADEVVLADGELKRLEQESFVIVRLGDRRAIVFRGGDGALRALDAKCTHEGCTVQYRPGEDDVWCACHNARFDGAGRVLSGPPPRPLAPFGVKEAAVGSKVQVTVTKA